jgi:hypothetical protein
MAQEDEKASAHAQRISIIQDLNSHGDTSLGTVQYVPAQVGTNFWNSDTPEHFEVVPPSQGLRPSAMGNGDAMTPTPTPTSAIQARGLVAPPRAAVPSGAPPARLLKEGVQTTFKNGQTWTLQNGVPVKVR